MKNLLESKKSILEEINNQIKECSKHKINDVNNLVHKIGLLRSFIYEYTCLDDETLDTDDEIINWVLTDVWDDLLCSVTNLLIGYYKTVGSCLRNSLEIGIAGLYFQTHQNKPENESKYNEEFIQWDTGASTPSLKKCMKYIRTIHENIGGSKDFYNFDITVNINKLYGELSNFSHGRAFSKSLSKPEALATNNMNLGVGYDEQNFERFSIYINKTISCIATIWLISFPKMLMGKRKLYYPIFEITMNEETFKLI